MARRYRIPVVYQLAGTMIVEADSLEEAVQKAIHEEKLPEDGEYLTDSLEIDEESSKYGDIECQCGSCENQFWKSELDELDACPYCGSGNWVEGCIDEN